MLTIIEIPPFKIIITKHEYFKIYVAWSRHLSKNSFTLLFSLFGIGPLLYAHDETKAQKG